MSSLTRSTASMIWNVVAVAARAMSAMAEVSFGKQEPPKPGPACRNFGPMRRVETHAARDVLHVRADALADLRDLVDERDLRGQEAVRRVLDQLRRLDVGDDERDLERVQRRVDLLHQLDRLVVGGADDDAVRLHEVLDGRAFAQELGIRDDRGLVPVAASRRGCCSIIRPVPMGTVDFVMTSFGPFMCCGDRAGHVFDVAEVGRAVRLRRRADGDEDGARCSGWRRPRSVVKRSRPSPTFLLTILSRPGS